MFWYCITMKSFFCNNLLASLRFVFLFWEVFMFLIFSAYNRKDEINALVIFCIHCMFIINMFVDCELMKWNDAFILLVTQIWSDKGDYKRCFWRESSICLVTKAQDWASITRRKSPPSRRRKNRQKMDEALQCKLNQRPQRVIWRHKKLKARAN